MHIPPEIHEIILSQFLPFEENHDSYDTNQSALVQCALVSQEFSAIARPLIFTNIFIREGRDRNVARRKFKLLEAAFKRNDSLPSFVRTFTLHTAGYDRDDINRFDNLYYDPALPFILSQFTFLESLAIDTNSRLDNLSRGSIEWRRLSKELQAALEHVFDANSQHLKRLHLSKIPGIPLLKWAWKLESLSYLNIGPFMLTKDSEFTDSEGQPKPRLVDGLSRVAPSTVEFRQFPCDTYLERLMQLYPGFFRKTKKAKIWTPTSARLPITLSALLQASADTLQSFTLDLAIWSGENSPHAAEFPPLPSLTELVLRFDIVHPDIWGVYESFVRPFLPLCVPFLENAPNLAHLSIAVIGPCTLLTEASPDAAISPLREFDGVFARSASPATLFSVRIELVQTCSSKVGCDKCVGFGTSHSEGDVRKALPSLGSFLGTRIEYITERRVDE